MDDARAFRLGYHVPRDHAMGVDGLLRPVEVVKRPGVFQANQRLTFQLLDDLKRAVVFEHGLYRHQAWCFGLRR